MVLDVALVHLAMLGLTALHQLSNIRPGPEFLDGLL
jgi:hypothetical protein